VKGAAALERCGVAGDCGRAVQESKLDVPVSLQEGRAAGQQPALSARTAPRWRSQQDRNREALPEPEGVEFGSQSEGYLQRVFPRPSLEHRVIFPWLSRHVEFPKVSDVPRMRLPLLAEQRVLPKLSLEQRVVFSSLSRHREFPNESVVTRVTFPKLSRHTVFPNVTVVHRFAE